MSGLGNMAGLGASLPDRGGGKKGGGKGGKKKQDPEDDDEGEDDPDVSKTHTLSPRDDDTDSFRPILTLRAAV